jgi:hypothetical protein
MWGAVVSRCPKCQSKTRVVATRESLHGTRRRRECRKCGHRFTTFELPVLGIVSGLAKSEMPDAVDIAALVEMPDADEIAASIELPDGPTAEEIADALLDEAERRAALGESPRLELVEGDYDEDAG